jgi:hypothetical protein
MSELDINWTQLIETALTAPGNLGNTYNRFYEYSYLNQILLLWQGVTEPVATYNRWQALGRQVKKGAKAKFVNVPIPITRKDDQGTVTERFTIFKLKKGPFVYSDTEGPELPPVEVPGFDLDTALFELGISKVPFTSTDGNTQGYSSGHEYAINPVAANPTATTFHELAHIVLGHTAPDQNVEYQLHRGVKEFQAEATAYLVLHELERLDERTASKSRAYIQHWLSQGSEAPSDTDIRQVFQAATKILKAGRKAAASTPQAVAA